MREEKEADIDIVFCVSLCKLKTKTNFRRTLFLDPISKIGLIFFFDFVSLRNLKTSKLIKSQANFAKNWNNTMQLREENKMQFSLICN